MLKKYALTSDCIRFMRDSNLHRIVALRDFGNVKAYELGGYVEDESNLSQEGDCWIGQNAKVFDHATVTGSALVSGDAQVHGGAHVTDHARVFERAEIRDGACIVGNLMIGGDAVVWSADGYKKDEADE
ncbi:hypothetical protein [Murdochiella massiliensis]|uniref:hypothetical protein n=1 Tax=Murdochiella massiliensis TaxID=1673723 RepID=UPI000834C521|nr:hypothetical protein [Murdochiella massiliensis]